MSNRSARETTTGAGVVEGAVSSSGFYLVEVRRTPGAAGYRAAARAVEDLETQRFPTLSDVCRFLEAAMDAIDGQPDDSCAAGPVLGSQA
jgi:hypothetical protein